MNAFDSTPSAPKLTDPVMPEQPTTGQPFNMPTSFQPPAKKTPAITPRASRSPKPSFIFIVLLAIIAFASTAAAAFLFIRTQTLTQQVNTLQSISDQRQLSPTPTQKDTTNEKITPTPTLTDSPTATLSSDFLQLSDVLAAARDDSPNAQLLMITIDNLLNPLEPHKYWFRTAPDIKTYFYVETSSGDPQLFRPATVTPDNNIPDLIPDYDNSSLGINATSAHQLIMDSVISPLTDSTPVSVRAQYIKATPTSTNVDSPVNLWQLTYEFSDRNKVVVQLNAVTTEVVYSNVK